MSRFFLALVLVSQLSGFAGAAAVVCEAEMTQSQACCCHHEQSGAPLPASRVALPACPCTMAPPLPAPVTRTPVVVAGSRILTPMPAVITSVLQTVSHDPQSLAATRSGPAPAAQPVLSASHLRC